MTRSDAVMSDLVCLNCDGPVNAEHPVFCSNRCREIAGAVRYGRAAKADGRIERDPTVAEALKIKIAIAVGGGYPTGIRRLSPQQRQAVFERDDSRCQICSSAGTEIDHIDSVADEHINDLENLQLLCSDCHRQKTLSSTRPADEREQVEIRRILERIDSEQPVRDCDVPDWNQRWRSLRSERLKEF